jgi:tryptophan synthase alpha chain
MEHRAPWKAGAVEAGIALVPFWAPTADPARTREVLSQNDLLAYLVTRRGTTGGALWDPAEIVRRARESRALGGPALMAGFGIRTREQLQELSGEVDLAVVGTLLAEALESGGGPEAVLRLVSELAG